MRRLSPSSYWWKVALAVGASAAVVVLTTRRGGTDAPSAPSNVDVNKGKTTKSKRATKDVPLESSSPIGHEEIEREIARESTGEDATGESIHPSRERSQERKPAEPDQPLNPRRQRNSRPD